MGAISAALKHMLAAGMDNDAIIRAVADMEASEVPVKSARQLRNARYYERKTSEKRLKASETSDSDGSVLNASRARVEDKTSNLDIEPQKKEQKDALTREFALIWSEYPNKVGKPKALAAFIAARKRASFEAMMAGLRRYIAVKPADRAWLNPATFFNQDRWDDQPANVIPMARGSPAREIDQLLDFAIERTGHYDADATAEIEGYQAAPRGLPAH